MAVGTSVSFNIDGQGIVRNAMQTAGILGAGENPSAEETAMGLEWLNLGMKEWQAGGRYLRTVDRKSIALANGVAAIAFEADAVDIELPAMVVMVASGRESRVDRMTLDYYQGQITDKTQTGVPSFMLIERNVTMVGTLWPVPDTSLVSTLNYVKVRLLKDNEVGTNADVHQRAVNTAVLMLAVRFSEWAGKSDAKIMRLEARYTMAKAVMESDNTERGDIDFILGGL